MKTILKFSHLSIVLIMAIALCGTSADMSLARRRKKTRTPEETLEASVKREIKIGEKVAEEIAKHMNFIEDPIVTARVKTIFNRLTPWVTRPLPYDVHVVKEDSPNAFCIPGGNIYVTSGLIDFVNSDAEMAFVIAHELSHADGNHVIIQMERNQKISLAALAIMIASRGQAAAIALSNAAAIAMSNSYSRDLEQAADMGAIEIAEKAGYDLSAGVTVMEGLAREELKQPWYDPKLALDHPRIADRIQYIADAIEAKGYKISRKKSMKLLIPSVISEDGAMVLKIDDTEILRGSASDELSDCLNKSIEALQRALQVETAVYDIHIERKAGLRSVFVGVTPCIPETLPGVTEKLETIRSRMVAALGEAHKKNPLTNLNL